MRLISTSNCFFSNFTCSHRINNYTFNWDRMLSFEGDTGPYLQYAHVRLSSIERKNPELLPLPAPSHLKTELLVEPQAREVRERADERLDVGDGGRGGLFCPGGGFGYEEVRLWDH